MAARKNKKLKKAMHGLERRLERRMAGRNGQNAWGDGQGTGPLGGLAQLLPSRRSEQFLLGAAIGAAAAYVLADDELRGKLIKSGIKLYSSVMGGFEEMREQVADIQAEVQAEQNGAA
jgi:hypothetical protein